MGREVAEALLRRFSGDGDSSVNQMDTGFELIERAST
jgi:LacI family gluconate utilization system Gnt-I transcriptional repressor